jgi:DNA-binding PadR family transcriptional regulator
MEIVEQEDRPNRKVYYITDDGLAELRRWLKHTKRRRIKRAGS